MIIALGHRARSGKDTLADYLVAKHGFTKVAFAGPLKEAARDIFLLDDEQMYGDLKEVVDPRWGRTPRDIMQKLGTEAVRNVFGQDTWVNRCKIGLDPKKNYVVTDCRFPNEADAVKAWGGYVVRIDRPSLPPLVPPPKGVLQRLSYWLTGKKPGHPSETALLDYTGWDAVVKNDGTLDDLYKRGEGVLMDLLTYEVMRDLESKLFKGQARLIENVTKSQGLLAQLRAEARK